MIICYKKKHGLGGSIVRRDNYVPVVKRIECELAEFVIVVRFHAGTQKRQIKRPSHCDHKFYLSITFFSIL